MTETADCVVVGAGLAGLSAAHRLATAGRRVVVVEAEPTTGGRAATVWHDGLPVDRGFQSMFLAYPETRSFLDAIGIRRDELLPLERGAVVDDGAGWRHLTADPRALRGLEPFGAGDVLRLGRLAAEVARRSPDELLDGAEQALTAAEYLARCGFSARSIEGFFRPLFGVITLDRTLGCDAAYFRFLFAMLTRGPAVMPVDGHGMITERAAAELVHRGGRVHTGARATRVITSSAGRAAGVRLEDGTEILSRAVVMAVAAAAAAGLLEPIDPAAAAAVPREQAAALTLAYILDTPLYRGRAIILNSAPADGGARVDLVCQTSNTLRPAVAGSHVLLAMTVTTGLAEAPEPEAVAAALSAQIERWSPGFDLGRRGRLVEVVHHPHAQFRVTPGVRAGLPDQ
ncbi:MAG: FAD-dependent oxidoreductase, partial [Miltoncostaeaceae bacterium]